MSTPLTEAAEDVRTLPRLDETSISEAAQAWVASRMSECADAEDRAKTAAQLVIKEDKATEKVRAERDAAACTLSAYYRVRRGADIPGALGVNRTRWKNIRDRVAAQHGFTRAVEDRSGKTRVVGSWDDLMAAGYEFPRVPNAPAVLPGLAKQAETHAQRAEFARRARDAAARELGEQRGWSNARIARLIGRDASRVSHIKHKEVA